MSEEKRNQEIEDMKKAIQQCLAVVLLMATISIGTAGAQELVADFSTSIEEGSPLTVKFIDKSMPNENVTSWNWYFGDSSNSRDQNPKHTYQSEGLYSVTLSVTDENNDTYETTRSVDVYPPQPQSVANFSVHSLTGKAPFYAHFMDQSSGDPTEWQWYFGDGGSSDEQNPDHKYEIAGTYTVWLGVTYSNGAILTDHKTIVVTDAEKILPVADFTGNVSSGYAPLGVQFTDASENATGWSWDFGDGGSSVEKNPTHTFATVGNFNVSLTASNEDGENSKVKTISVSARPEEEEPEEPAEKILPVAKFTSNTSGGYAPLGVQFTDASENATDWSWNFGDGASSAEQNPMHAYTTVGNYTVNLTVSNKDGVDSKVGTISVSAKPAEEDNEGPGPGPDPNTDPDPEPVLAPMANFSCDFKNGTAPLTVNFTDHSENAASWEWKFGDSIVSNEKNPTHTFSNAGKYEVVLKVKNGSLTSSKSVYITVEEPYKPTFSDPVAVFSVNITEGCIPLVVKFTDESKNAESRKWDFGDGSMSAERNPVHIYNCAGTFTANLTVSNPNGVNSKTVDITAKSDSKSGGGSSGPGGMNPRPVRPVADFEVSKPHGGSSHHIQFADHSKDANGWEWDFGDGEKSKERNPAHIYKRAGKYPVTLKVKNNFGKHSKFMNINVIDEKCVKPKVVEEKCVKPKVVKPACPAKIAPGIKPDKIEEDVGKKSGFVPGYIGWNHSPISKEDVASRGHHSASYVHPVAKFKHAALGSLSIQFTDLSAGKPTGWKWDFGDGQTSTKQNPIHKYAKAGTYTVRLTVQWSSVTSDKIKIK